LAERRAAKIAKEKAAAAKEAKKQAKLKAKEEQAKAKEDARLSKKAEKDAERNKPGRSSERLAGKDAASSSPMLILSKSVADKIMVKDSPKERRVSPRRSASTSSTEFKQPEPYRIKRFTLEEMAENARREEALKEELNRRAADTNLRAAQGDLRK
jgi:hypothetical protein